MLRIGVQVSISGKIYKAVDRAVELGCNTMQIFSRNPRSFRRKALEKREIEEFILRRKKASLYPLIIHAVYTQNLASVHRKFYRLSVRDFMRDLNDAQVLGAEFLVTHLGSYKRSSYEAGIERVIGALDKILTNNHGDITILLENTSGSGYWLGAQFYQISYILEKLGRPEKLGICLDTCHAYAAGYNLTTQEGLEALLREIEELIGLDKLKLIHLNDSRDKVGSRRDRHWHIGEGNIGEEGFRRILTHPKLRDIPFILETPKKDHGDDIKNLNKVRKLARDNYEL